MPADRGRASKACTACRKQKTRCYASEKPGAACLRCETLGQSCSLIITTPRTGGSSAVISEHDVGASTTDFRLSRLEKAVHTLFERIGEQSMEQSTRSPTPTRVSDMSLQRSLSQTLPTQGDQPNAPVFILRDLAAEMGAESPQSTRHPEGASARGVDDIIDAGLLSVQDALSLLDIFREHYGRWVAFDENSPLETLLSAVRKSSLLLCACCLIAVRHTTQEAAARLAPHLFDRARSQLSTALLVSPQPIEFFQATLVLCMWSTTVGQVPLSIDSWLLSGFAIQHCLSSDLFDTATSKGRSLPTNKLNLDNWCLWNHLCLAHLHYSVGTRRKSMISRAQVDRCREVLAFDRATNFETRMVAEINLYWIIYEYCSAPQVDLPKIQTVLHNWKKDWNFVLAQTRSQFLEMGFHFAQLLAYERSLKSKSARVRDSLLNEMVRLSSAIIQLAMDTADDRTKHLSDHIYHMITFAAVTLCRLLHLYENQIAVLQNVGELDSLILNLVAWLHSIGLPCHAAHTLGDTVSAFHRKLRPLARPASPPPMNPPNWFGGDVAPFFPGLLDADLSDSGNWNLLPDWEPLYQGPLT